MFSLGDLTKPKLKTAPKTKSDPEPKSKSPATPLMKEVAAKAYNEKAATKVFSSKEIQNILRRRSVDLPVEPEETLALREAYRRIKRQVKELEKGNQSRVIIFPSLVGAPGWYKAIQFSALYYAYRLADRMGRKVRVLKDTDRFSKAEFAVSITNLEKFTEQFRDLESPSLEITEDGIYIFTLQTPLTDDEVGQLRLVEETRRDRMHNILRPKDMDPATFADLMMISRQLVPRVKKLESPYFASVGCRIVSGLHDLLAIYNHFADGILSREEAGVKLILAVDDIIAGLTILAENRVWGYDVSAIIGENANQVKRRIVKDFNPKPVATHG